MDRFESDSKCAETGWLRERDWENRCLLIDRPRDRYIDPLIWTCRARLSDAVGVASSLAIASETLQRTPRAALA